MLIGGTITHPTGNVPLPLSSGALSSFPVREWVGIGFVLSIEVDPLRDVESSDPERAPDGVTYSCLVL